MVMSKITRALWECLSLRVNLMISVAVVILISDALILTVVGQDCTCSVPCAQNVTEAKCPSGRLIPRRDCACCLVCAKQLSESCNHVDFLCDADFGLICGQEGKCQAETSCVDDTNCSAERFCFGGACADPCKVFANVCHEKGPTNGICSVRSQRALCTCTAGQSIVDGLCVDAVAPPSGHSEKTEEKLGIVHCNFNGSVLTVGESVYRGDKCAQKCECGSDGEMKCREVEAGVVADCKPGFVAISVMGKVTTECELLLGNMTEFDGCCVPESCQNVTTQEHHKFQNIISTDDQNSDQLLPSSREMLFSTEDHRVDNTTKESHSHEEGSVNLTIVQIMPTLASINLPEHETGAILSIALTEEVETARDAGPIWKEHKIPPGLQMLTLSDLTPNNSYTVRYTVGSKTYPEIHFSTPGDGIDVQNSETIQEMMNKTQEEVTGRPRDVEELEMTTIDATNVNFPTVTSPPGGCLYNNSLHQVGSIIFEDCDTRCECLADGEMKCMERCSIPFFKNGTFTSDPLCFEEPSGIDDCCVIVACARTSHAGMARELSLNPCDMVECGPNADCRSEVSPTGMQSENSDTLCVCKEGFGGDPYDRVKGCQLVASSTQGSVLIPNLMPGTVTEGCLYNNRTFSHGEEYLDGCSYKCHCETSGEFLCFPRCRYRHDEELKVPEGCQIEKDGSDPECCESLVCPGETTEVKREKTRVSTDGCIYKNRTYEKEEKFFDDCDQQCMCFTNGDVTCQARCPPVGSLIPDKDCITLPDPLDPCCNVTICGNHTASDVMKEAIELEKRRVLANTSTERARILDEIDDMHFKPPDFFVKLSEPISINETAILISIHIPEDQLGHDQDVPIRILYSTNETAPPASWSSLTLKVKDLFVEGSDELHTIVTGLEPGTQYYFRVNLNGSQSKVRSGRTKSIQGSDTSDESGNDSGPTSGEVACTYKGKSFEAEEEFYDGCDEYCICEGNGTVTCSPIECPTEFGLDLVDVHCVKWEPVDAGKEKVPPNCCSQMKCVQNSSCTYQGFSFNNFEEIPEKLSGCEKRCYCEYGNVSCQNACGPLPEKPPKSLPCHPESAVVMPMLHNPCCKAWMCPGGESNKTNGTQPLLPSSNAHSHQNQTVPPVPPGIRIIPNHPLINHGSIYDEEGEDQLLPPSFGNQPMVIPLDKLHAHHLQQLLHQLATENESGNDDTQGPKPFGHGVYVSAKDSNEIKELERNGAKVMGPGPDGTVILLLPPDGHRHHEASLPFPPPPPPFSRPIPPGSNQFPFPTHHPGNTGISHDEITGVTIRALNDSTLHIDFTVSPVLVGLQGAVEVSYTNEFPSKPDPAQWEKQLFQQPEDIIDNSHLQLFLSGLKPNSQYHLQIQVIISSVHNSPTSDIYVIRTPPQALPPIVKIDPEIKILETSSRTVEIAWRKFTDFEDKLIDGVQVKYKAYDDQFYATSELIHRSILSYKLTNLQPGTKYEVELLLVPFTNQTTELKSESAIHFETQPEVDDFSFTVALESGKIGEQSTELIWEGVPFPEDKFVNIYQVLYQSDNEKEQKSYFKVPDRETTKKAVLKDLKPGTRYRVWLEAFLTNGKKKRSNVIYVLTKVGNLPAPEKSEQETNLLHAQSPAGVVQPVSSYYGALVALAIVATISVIGIIVLLMILIKKQSQSKLPINDRKSESSYDNPSFKNYDMEANGHSNKASEL